MASVNVLLDRVAVGCASSGRMYLLNVYSIVGNDVRNAVLWPPDLVRPDSSGEFVQNGLPRKWHVFHTDSFVSILFVRELSPRFLR